MDLGIKGKVALVTASSKGIGKAIAFALAAEGCQIAICSRNKNDLLNTSEELKKKYGIEPSWNVCDLNKQRDVENTVNAVVKQLGRVDILVTNCGGPVSGLLKELKEDDWQAAFDQVLMSVVRLCNMLVPDMVLREWGRIINVTSISVKQPIANLMLSNSLRSGVIGFAKSLSNEVAKHNITVNNIAPGYTLTNRLYELAVIRSKQSGLSHEEALAEMSKNIPMNRLAKPEEIASVVAFLASEKASYLTGNTIQVDGGAVKSLM